MGATRAEFVGAITEQAMTLVIDRSHALLDGGALVEHPRCDHLADVVPAYDSVYCRACGLNDRVSGAWVVDVYEGRAGSTGDGA